MQNPSLLGLDLGFNNSHCRWREQEGALVREGNRNLPEWIWFKIPQIQHPHPQAESHIPHVLHRKVGKGGSREQAAHLSPATPSPLASVIYGVIWAASNLIKGQCKLVNRFK